MDHVMYSRDRPSPLAFCRQSRAFAPGLQSQRLTQTHADSRRLTQTEDKLSKSVARVLEHFLVEVISLQLKAFDVVAMSGTCVLPFVNSFWEEAASALFMRARVSYFGSF